MRFIRQGEATKQYTGYNKPMPTAENVYRWFIIDSTGIYRGFLEMGADKQKCYLFNLQLEGYTSFSLAKILRFCESYADKQNLTLQLQFTLTKQELEGTLETAKAAMLAVAEQKGYAKCDWYREKITMQRSDIAQSFWVQKLLKAFARDGGIVLPKGYRVYPYSELTEAQWQYMKEEEKAHFATFVSCEGNKPPHKDYSFAVFKADVFVAYLTFVKENFQTGKIMGIASHRNYPGAGLIAFENLVYCVHMDKSIKFLQMEYTKDCTDGKRMLKPLLGDKIFAYSCIQGYEKNARRR